MLLLQRAAALMVQRSSARAAASSSSIGRNIKCCVHSSSLITTHKSFLNHAASNNNESVFSIKTTSRTMSSKPCFAWEGKRVEVTNAEELQRRLNRIKVSCTRTLCEMLSASLSSILKIFNFLLHNIIILLFYIELRKRSSIMHTRLSRKS